MRVTVNVYAAAYLVRVELHKPVTDQASRQQAITPTWWRGSVGVHSGRSDYILQKVSELMDLFLDEYLRVNAEACTPPSRQRPAIREFSTMLTAVVAAPRQAGGSRGAEPPLARPQR